MLHVLAMHASKLQWWVVMMKNNLRKLGLGCMCVGLHGGGGDCKIHALNSDGDW